MSAINLGPQGLPIQITPAVPQTAPSVLTQPPLPVPPTAIPALDRQADSGTGRHDVARRDGSAPPGNGRGRLVDLKA